MLFSKLTFWKKSVLIVGTCFSCVGYALYKYFHVGTTISFFLLNQRFFSLMDRHQLCYPGIGYGLYCYKRYRTTRSETTVQKHQWEDITYIVVVDLIRLSTVGLTEWDCVFPPDVCLWCEECGMAVGWPKWMWRRMSVQVWNSRWKNRHNYKKKCL